MENYSVKAVLSATDKGFTSTMAAATKAANQLEDSTDSSSSSIVSFASAFAIAEKAVSSLASVLSSSLSSAISRVDTLNQYPKIMEQLGYSAEEAEDSISKLSDGIDGLPTSLDTIVSSTQSLTLLTGDIDLATDSAIALNDAFYASGSSASDAERGLTQYTQMLSSGTVDMQSWKTLLETMGYALNEVAESFGYAGSSAKNDLYKALQSGEITFDELNARIIELDTATGGFAEVARTASGGIATSFQNLQTAVVKGMANTISAMDSALENESLPTFQQQIEGVKDVVNKAFNSISDGAGELITTASPAIKATAENADLLAAALVPVAAGFTALKVVDTAKKRIDKFKKSGEQAGDTLKALRDRTELAAKAAETESKAVEASVEATEAKKAADEAAKKAAETKTTAVNAARKAEQAESDAAIVASNAGEDSAQAAKALAKQETLKKEAVEASRNAELAEAEALRTKQAADTAATNAANLAGDAVKARTESEAAETIAANASSAAALAKSAALAVMTGQMGLAEAAQVAFNAAVKANPIGLAITAVTGLATALSTVYKALDKAGKFEDTFWKKTSKLKDNVEELNDTLESNAESYESVIKEATSTSTQIDTLVDSIVELSNKENKTSDETAALASYAESLNDVMEDLNLAYDEEADNLSMTTALLEAKADAYKAQEEYSAYVEKYNGLIADQLEIEEQLAEAKALYEQTQNDMNTAMETGAVAGIAYVGAITSQEQAIEDLEAKQAEYAEEIDTVSAQIQESYEAEATAAAEAAALQSEALAESIANQTISLEDLSEANQEVAESMQAAYQDVRDAATDMFDTISTESDLSIQDMIENLEKNNQAVSEWGDNMESLRDRFENLGLDAAILDQLADMGTDGAAYVAELADASDTELQDLVGIYGEAGESSSTAYFQALGSDNAEQIAGVVTNIGESLREQADAADWTSVGDSISSGVLTSAEEAVENADTSGLGLSFMEGTALGISDNTSIVEEAAAQAMEDIRQAAGNAVGEGSPATSYIELGENMVSGLAEGLGTYDSAVSAATEMAEETVSAVERVFDSADFSKAGKTAFKGLETAMDSSMSAMQSAASKGSQKIYSTLNSNLSKSSSTVSSSINKINSTWSSGLSKMQSTTKTQLSSVNSAVKSGYTNMQSIVKSQTSAINSTVKSSWNTSVSYTKSGMNSINSTLTSGVSKAKSTASSGATGIANSFSGLYSKLYSTGAYAMTGLNNGMLSKKSTVLATAKSIANSVSSTISSALQVGSPSKVTRQIGQWTGEGLVLGLEDMEHDVSKASEAIAEAMIPAVQGWSDASGRFEYASEVYVDVASSDESDFAEELELLKDIKALLSDSQSTEFNFNLTSEIDGREVGKATATYTYDEIKTMEAREERKNKFKSA